MLFHHFITCEFECIFINGFHICVYVGVVVVGNLIQGLLTVLHPYPFFLGSSETGSCEVTKLPRLSSTL